MFFFFYFSCRLLPVACTSSHTACTEPKPPPPPPTPPHTHSIPIPLLKVCVLRERRCERDALGTNVPGRLPREPSVRSQSAFIFLRWIFLYRRVVFTGALLYLVCLIHTVEKKHWTGWTGKTRKQKYPARLRWTSVSQSQASLLQPHMYFVFFPLMYNLNSSFPSFQAA